MATEVDNFANVPDYIGKAKEWEHIQNACKEKQKKTGGSAPAFKLTIVEFFASNFGPCEQLYPFIKKWTQDIEEFEDRCTYLVADRACIKDVADDHGENGIDVATACGAVSGADEWNKCAPLWVFLKGNECVGHIKGIGVDITAMEKIMNGENGMPIIVAEDSD